MNNELTPEQSSELKEQLEKTKKDLETTRQQQTVVQLNPQDKFIETLVEKGGELLIQYARVTAENQRYEADKEMEFKKEELRVIDKLDYREKLYKGLLIGLCIIILFITPIFVEKAEIIIPVLSLIIGLLFKSSALSDFFSFSKKEKPGNDTD